MDSRLTKTLMGLGGTGAAGGGLYLSSVLSGWGNGRRTIDAAEVERAKVLEGYSKEVHGTEMGGYYVVMSHYLEDFWESNWIRKVENNSTSTFTYEKQEMESKEGEYWKKIMENEKIKIDKNTLNAINGENMEYWRKYKKFCLEWNKTRTKEEFEDNYMCITSETEEEYLKSPEYKKYLKAKVENSNLSFREFYWTEWKKFSKECNRAMINDQTASPNKISNYYDKWKTDPNSCQTQ